MAVPASGIKQLHEIKSFADFDGNIGTCQLDAPGAPCTTMLWKFCLGGDAYFAEIPKRLSDITIEEAKSLLQRVPDDEIYPKIPQDSRLTVVPTTSVPLFVKRPALIHYDIPGDHSWIGELLLSEAQIMERVSKTPHENIVQYYGCFVEDGRLKGIALKRYGCTLAEHFQDGHGPLKDHEAFMRSWSRQYTICTP
ncbi:uncharacterized protein DNG_02451 [Cephalotrichum gorgonifer]|uniref:Uncharacterized protein n=1 Tax=Cephalotrichum gorgonifer TaxID=2041049 RepID=A0AAE8MUW1_9PEZI|nr:uncharacterized protein DNG_02451 [Cephalotrichum gorgonifer]